MASHALKVGILVGRSESYGDIAADIGPLAQ
jgi:hypothetical protein